MINGWINILKERFDDEYIENNMKKYKSEDSPRTLSFQLDLLKKTGFSKTIVLHKHFNFAAFGAIK
jgi:tRNA (cmo5U34)-methyltransferase